ncbi:MAG: helix-turn-helix transcriptional regulator [Gemmatimonadaceae bacterium]
MRGERFPIACVGGLQTKAAVVEAPGGRVSVLGIRLHPVGAYRLFGRRLDATTGFTIDLLDLVGPDGPDLAARCFDAATVEARFRIVIEWIERRMARAARPNAGIAWAVARLERSSGAVSIGELVNGSNITPARFISLFTQHVGLPPKRYGRLLRFRHALDLLQGDSKLSDVALSAGYYDQPHLNADFREFAGMTPTAFINARRYPNSSSMQEPG